MDVEEALRRCGGVADHATLLRMASRGRLRRALRKGVALRIGHGRYALPTAQDALVAAHRLRGVVSHRSAAAWWGWELKEQPVRPEVTVPKHRRGDVSGTRVFWSDVPADDVREGIVTSRERTVVDCLRVMAFDEGLALADSVLRSGDLTEHDLARIAAAARGPGSAVVRLVVAAADGRAANPFESVLRALAIEVGLDVRPQVVLPSADGEVRPDLVDRGRLLVLEADSFEWHGRRAALRRDCRRYNAMVRVGWQVLRFAWEDVMHDQDYVREALRDMLDPPRRTDRAPGRRRAA